MVSAAVSGTTLDGWTLVTGEPEDQPGGTNVFEVWSNGDTILNAGGEPVVLQSAEEASAGTNWIELNDAASGNAQALGIERTITTKAGYHHDLSMLYAAPPGYDWEYGEVRICVDGVELGHAKSTEPVRRAVLAMAVGRVHRHGRRADHPDCDRGLAPSTTEGRGAMIGTIALLEAIPERRLRRRPGWHPLQSPGSRLE